MLPSLLRPRVFLGSWHLAVPRNIWAVALTGSKGGGDGRRGGVGARLIRPVDEFLQN